MGYNKHMAYTKTNWLARAGNGLNRFKKSQETASSVVLTPDPENVTVPGTPFTAENMNHIEEGIAAAHEGVSAEALAREQADTALQNSLNTEIKAREDTDAALQEETKAREDADTALQSSLNAEIKARKDTDAALQEETKAREDADTALQNAINAEALAREQSDEDLQNQINTLMPEGLEELAGFITELPQELQNMKQADTELQNGIESEAQARVQADTALQGGLEAEVRARAARDTALQDQINTLMPTGLESLPALLDKKANKEEVDRQLALKAPLASPAFTGTPTAPTPAFDASSTQIATTSFVRSLMPKQGSGILVSDYGAVTLSHLTGGLHQADINYLPGMFIIAELSVNDVYDFRQTNLQVFPRVAGAGWEIINGCYLLTYDASFYADKSAISGKTYLAGRWLISGKYQAASSHNPLALLRRVL